jgi:hypothetical protein
MAARADEHDCTTGHLYRGSNHADVSLLNTNALAAAETRSLSGKQLAA